MQKAKSTEGVQPIGNCGVSPKSKPSVLPAVMLLPPAGEWPSAYPFGRCPKAAETFLHNRWMEGESQMDKPVIGVLPGTNGDGSGFFMVPAYARSIEASGGIPVMLPLTADEAVLRQLAALCAGFLLPGGQDISPMVYDEPVSEGCGPCCAELDRMELLLLRELLDRDKPVFGICRGLQFLNAALGGTLYQDLPSERPAGISHRQTQSADAPCHSVMLAEGSPLQALLRADTISVNSFHPQAVKTLAPPLSVAALSEDRLVEAVWMPSKRFVRAVQWHPELSFMTDENSRRLFADFVAACCI